MRELSASVKALSEYRAFLKELSSLKTVSIYGTAPVHRAHFVSALSEDLRRPVCVITADDRSAKILASDVQSFTGKAPAYLPSRDLLFYDADGVSRELEQARLAAFYEIASGEKNVIVGSTEAFMLRTLPGDMLLKRAVHIKSGESYDLPELCERLTESGYKRCLQIDGVGQFALRGGILDVFPAGFSSPVRAEFFGDEVDLLSFFDLDTQRRTDNLDSVRILPARETQADMAQGGKEGFCAALFAAAEKKNIKPELKKLLLSDAEKAENGILSSADRWMGYIYPFASGLSHIPQNAVVIVSDAQAVSAAAEGFEKRQQNELEDLLKRGLVPRDKDGWGLSEKAFINALSSHPLGLMDSFLSSSSFTPQAVLSLNAKQLSSAGNLETMVQDLETYLGQRFCLFAMTGTPAAARSLSEILKDRGFDCVLSDENAGEGKVCVLPDSLSDGFEYPAIGLAVICSGEGKSKKTGKKKSASRKNALKSFDDLTPGDLVVHEHHGIGRFVSIESIQVENTRRDYLKIAFDKGDSLFVPATALHLVSKYIGAGENQNVRLSRLGGAAWEKTRARAKQSARDLARGLIELYAKRQKTEGFLFDPDNDWQRAFEESFEFEETEDQLICTQEIKKDMQSPHPMDRLLCGDVGFGKTEVAFRAVMKCILSGKQAAILAPTTVLARQHFVNASQRFSSYPIKIELLSRFRTPSQIKASLKRIQNGECDLVIGTHRLLQKDVLFRDLGLLVVDEEQRFGVTHKEKIKQMTEKVDVLTLTATPIPRTLNMALSGIRDMSVLEEPPLGRQPVQTYVMEYDERVIFDAIRRELARGGQVYYLHNRVESIERCAARIKEAFPEETVATAHGKMDEREISGIMDRMYGGEISVLVCTTIIETGVDISNVNTLIIEDADKMGLSQLHQIRGRVGRSPRRAFAYFTYRRGKVLTEIAQKRLSAIREFAEFGSGFKIAMRDLEIRGAGNLLGAEQSGHMMSVGYDMYLRLLSEATSELRGEEPKRTCDCTADLPVSAGIPQGYIEDPGVRIEIYRRIAKIEDMDDMADMQDELCDRFGEIPAQVQTLLDIALLRADASKLGVSDITQKNRKLSFTLSSAEPEKVVALCSERQFAGRLHLSASGRTVLTLSLTPSENPLTAAKTLIRLYGQGGI